MPSETHVLGSTQLRSRLGRMLDDALAGHSTIIERHGRRIARVVPYGEYSRLEERLTRLEALAESVLGPNWEAELVQQENRAPSATSS